MAEHIADIARLRLGIEDAIYEAIRKYEQEGESYPIREAVEQIMLLIDGEGVS